MEDILKNEGGLRKILVNDFQVSYQGREGDIGLEITPVPKVL